MKGVSSSASALNQKSLRMESLDKIFTKSRKEHQKCEAKTFVFENEKRTGYECDLWDE